MSAWIQGLNTISSDGNSLIRPGIVYSVDGTGSMAEGLILHPQTLDAPTVMKDNPGGALRAFFFPVTHAKVFAGALSADDHNQLLADFPEGLARHGLRYTFDSPMNENWWIEHVFELVRRAYYPKMPSRFVSVFGCESLESAVQFSQEHDRLGRPIFEIHHNGGYRLDMRHLRLNAPVETIRGAHRYWKGIGGENPLWEFVAPLPVKVGKRVA